MIGPQDIDDECDCENCWYDDYQLAWMTKQRQAYSRVSNDPQYEPADFGLIPTQRNGEHS